MGRLTAGRQSTKTNPCRSCSASVVKAGPPFTRQKERLAFTASDAVVSREGRSLRCGVLPRSEEGTGLQTGGVRHHFLVHTVSWHWF